MNTPVSEHEIFYHHFHLKLHNAYEHSTGLIKNLLVRFDMFSMKLVNFKVEVLPFYNKEFLYNDSPLTFYTSLDH